MPTYISELIEVPERVDAGDFVLKLSDGVAHPEATLDAYVVTEQLARCFDAALAFIRSGVESGSSKAAYLHGSFGAGKSHFMAVLHLLLARHPAARSKAGLEGVVTGHDAWLEGRRFLLVPYHMIGQPSMEAAVLGGYARWVRTNHPEAPVPGVYRAEALIADARRLRERLGDEAFFAGLGGREAGGGWGELEGAWDAARFAAACAAAPGSDERAELIGALIGAYFHSYAGVAEGAGETFVPLDEGLAVISRHARALGYDALVLFLDELILWLATHASNQDFLNEEGAKVSKLVEAQSAERPVPILSFVARQRDLRELVGDAVTGAQQLGFGDVLRWWEARFDTITLEDSNLPEIAAQRVLRPRSEAARQRLEQSWAETRRIRDEVLDVLLTARADRETFRKVYPFSPALIETLVAASSVLQRERTALKVMVQLLVEQRDTLELGQIVPVGDLFDVIASSDQPVTEGMRLHFENAQRLYRTKLLPLLEKEHGMGRAELEALPAGDPRARAFRADDRLIKTLLLAALVPEVEALKGLNSARLAALNHGSVSAPIPGRERQEVLRRLRRWASQVGEIKIGEEADPVITLQISGVDTEGILANARAVDNAGNRRRKIRALLFEQLGIEEGDELFLEHALAWRGTRRTFQVIFGNVRELPADSLATQGAARKLIVDFPFDEPGFTPAEDAARLAEFRAAGRPARTLVWLPAFLSVAAQKDLGTLVVLDEILKSDDSFRRHASHLAGTARAQARELLRNQQSSLRQRLIGYLEGAYGVASPAPGSVDPACVPPAHFESLDPGFTPQAPAGMNLRQALESLLAQMLESQYPDHPRFGTEVKIGALRRVHEHVARAAQDRDGRVPVERPLRALMHQIAVPLGLGEMGDTHFALSRRWYEHLNREVEGEVTVAKLRAALDRPRPRGLPAHVENLVILLYADQCNRSFYLHGGPYPPRLDDLPDELELREQPLPGEEVWSEACARAARLFGLTVSPLRNASNVSELAGQLAARAGELLEACRGLEERLDGLARDFAIEAGGAARLRTARAAHALLRALAGAEGAGAIEALASGELAGSPEALATSLRKAPEVLAAVENTRWQLFEALGALADERAEAGRGIVGSLHEALAADEYAIALAGRLDELEGQAVRLLAALPGAGPGPGREPGPRPDPGGPGVEVLASAERRGLAGAEAHAALEELRGRLAGDGGLRLDLRWRLYREKPAK